MLVVFICRQERQPPAATVLSSADTQEVLHLLRSINETFPPYWNHDQEYQELQRGIANIHSILDERNDSAPIGSVFVY